MVGARGGELSAMRQVVCVTEYGNVYRANWIAIDYCERHARERGEFITEDMDEAKRVAKERLAALRAMGVEV